MHKGESGVPDFVLLNEVSENAIVQNLQVRFQGNFIYVIFFKKYASFKVIFFFLFFFIKDLYWRSYCFYKSLQKIGTFVFSTKQKRI